ncbi:curli production assembly protein CsgF [Microbulbifer thermotolerans]|uniref:Curli production assembly/transport component CsgF n=1 Tax=Microbulbifer thermotolerans TaxID=252514 RepID=A0AB35I1F9_MICTH|nr:curli assembly protein CsgF [Microbulbifer thermotolerans]MCX2781225.1 curli production assembly protein CsgF [Microbulbifer thermotolerans]MCX2783417.1 curli production assembly protein CsgF [Microbulbifer thermotolerans]MCX2793452.1 curli production assembly protein CsgF [Microbulbifer thermotolerans]MCX2802897.1 curli production assembly protein CsgF [Microbulbifer thermotolerans]MCX2803746.1 curli production assembly protein CsgF [Microbulbifer thermotolerans]
MKTVKIAGLTLAPVLFLIFTPLSATELIYEPVNPNFGGNPLNGSYLLNNAQAQDRHKDPDRLDTLYEQPSALDRFTDSLETRLLNQLLTDVGNGNSGELITDDFIVQIVDNDGVLTVLVTDRSTGDKSEIIVSGLNPTN